MRYSGKVGFVETRETSPSVWEDISTEVPYVGYVLQAGRKFEPSQVTTNYDVNTGNRISIVADRYVTSHFQSLRYIWWQGCKWRVVNVDIQPPRAILTLGGLWNHDTTGT